MSRKLTKQEKIDFIKSLDNLSEHEKSLLLAEIEKIDTLESLERYIDEIYQKAYKTITERITAFSEKYAKDSKLPLFLANFVLSMGEKREFFNNVEKFKKKYPEHEEKVQVSANPTRIEALTTENKMTMIDVTEKVNHKIEMHLKGTYQETYLERKFKYAKETGKEPVIKPERLDENVIDDIISRTFDGKRFSERIWGLNMDRVVGKVEHLVRDSLARDIPPSDNAKVLAVEFQVARHRAVTVLQTETNNIQAEATMAEYEDDDVKRYKYLATLEVHTCPICGELDGKIFKVKDAQRGINYPTMHPHCRCTTVPAIEDVGSRTAKDVVTGKTYNVKKGTTYEQWRQQQLDKHGIYAIDDKLNAERLEKQRVKTTKAQFLEFRQILGKENMPKTFAEFYDLKYNDSNKFSMIELDFRRQRKLLNNPQLILPNLDNMVISERKFTNYLFYPGNSTGFAKGKNFTYLLGYDINNYKDLIEEISNRASKYPTKPKNKDDFGHRYEQKMIMYGKKNNPSNVIVGWNVIDDEVHLTSIYIKGASDEDWRI